jgi:hypothetical protein
MADEELAGIVAELEALRERLAEVGLDALREAVESGEQTRPDLERRASRARTLLERAIAILTSRDRAAGGGEQ